MRSDESVQKELGIDEAGRGPVLGPLVMAGVCVPDDQIYLLREWGVDDSKRFGSGKKGKQLRGELAETISKQFAHHIIVLSSKEVDYFVEVRVALEQSGELRANEP